MRALFIAGWLLSLGFVALCWWQWAPVLAVAQQPGDLATLSGVIAVLPWAAGPGLLPWLRRMGSGGINLPHAEYWFSGPQRAASLDRLAPYLDAMGLMLSAFLCGVLAIDLWFGLQGRKSDDAHHLLATGLFVGLTLVWVVALMRAFPAPAQTELPQRGPSRRPRRPGDPKD